MSKQFKNRIKAWPGVKRVLNYYYKVKSKITGN